MMELVATCGFGHALRPLISRAIPARLAVRAEQTGRANRRPASPLSVE